MFLRDRLCLQSAKIEDVKAVLLDYAVQIGDAKAKAAAAAAAAEGGAAAVAVGDGGEDDAEAEAAAAMEAESIRALASVLT